MSTIQLRYHDGLTVTVDDEGAVVGRAPDGNHGQQLLGFSKTETPSPEHYPEAYRAPNFYTSDKLPEDLDELVGYYAQFVSAGGDFYGWAEPLQEVTRS